MSEGKKYVKIRGSFHQDTVDNWLLMIPATELSSDAKIVYQVLKKMQDPNGSSQTDSHSWYKISGLLRPMVDKALFELEKFGLIEFYYSPANIRQQKSVCTNYLLYHPLMQDRYPVIPCPYDKPSLPDPMNTSRQIKFHETLDAAEKIRADYGLPTIKKDIDYEEHNQV